MSNADADSGPADDPEMTQINLRLTQAFLDDLDATWREEGFRNRSDFIRWALRDAVRHPAFTREGWKDMATAEHEMRTGEGRTYSREEVIAMLESAPEE